MPWRLLTLLLIGQLLASMDASILTVATPVLQRELDASPTMLQAIFAAYTFTFGVLVVTGARLGDDRGHGNMFLAGLAGFTVSSLVCGLAPSAPVLLCGRLLQGACGALMTPQTLQVIQRRFSGGARVRAVGLYSMILSVGVLFGQLVGGVVVTTAGWRWALLINVPLGTVLFLAAFGMLRGEPPGRGRRLDVLGVALLSGAMALLLVPLLLGREQGWPWWVWPSLLAGAALLAVFARVERRRPAPLLDLTVLPSVSRGLVTVAGVMGSYGALLFALTLHLQDDLGYTPLRAGLAFAPYAAGFAAMSLSRWRPPGAVGPLALGCGALLVAALGWSAWSEVVLFVAGAGHAAGFSPVVAATVARVRPEHAPEATALLTTGALLAQAVAIATLGSVYLTWGLTATAVGIAGVCGVAALASSPLRRPLAGPVVASR
ncbi:MFS transporter [Solirubrobacter soli]|uniref:MFS transporter n=1 Tax=Solirubrobacter soli TaxID=363832 RepID=UPI00069F845F|nr:MFS transporter [Solirubrobacter soli]